MTFAGGGTRQRTVRIHTHDRNLDIVVNGDFTLTPGGNGLRSNGSGWIQVKERRGDSALEVRVESDSKGKLAQRFLRNGQPWSNDSETQAWMLEIIPQIKSSLR